LVITSTGSPAIELVKTLKTNNANGRRQSINIKTLIQRIDTAGNG